MKNLAITLIVSAFAVSSIQAAATWEKSGQKYEANTAASKKDLLWKEITANPKSNDWFSSIGLGGIFAESMSPSL